VIVPPLLPLQASQSSLPSAHIDLFRISVKSEYDGQMVAHPGDGEDGLVSKPLTETKANDLEPANFHTGLAWMAVNTFATVGIVWLPPQNLPV